MSNARCRSARRRKPAGSRAQGAVRLATSIEANWLLEDFGSHIELKDELLWNSDAERVERREGMAFGAILLDEARAVAPPSPEASRLLFDAAKARGVLSSLGSDGLGGLVARLALLREHFPEAGLPEIASGLDDAGGRPTLRRPRELRGAARRRSCARATPVARPRR